GFPSPFLRAVPILSSIPRAVLPAPLVENPRRLLVKRQIRRGAILSQVESGRKRRAHGMPRLRLLPREMPIIPQFPADAPVVRTLARLPARGGLSEPVRPNMGCKSVHRLPMAARFDQSRGLVMSTP